MSDYRVEISTDGGKTHQEVNPLVIEIRADVSRFAEAHKMATDYIARIRLEQETPTGRWKEFYSVPSSSNQDVTYVVAKDDNEQWGCSCPQWIFHTPRRDCKHIQKVKAKVAGLSVRDVTPDALSAKAQKAITRMARLELDKDAEPITLDAQDTGRAARLEV